MDTKSCKHVSWRSEQQSMLKNLTVSKAVTLLLLQKIITQLPHAAPGKHPLQLLHSEDLLNESLWRGNHIPQRHSSPFPNILLKAFWHHSDQTHI